MCRLRHEELLEAAHILPDGHPQGLAVVPNGLALCKLHHAAFDSYIIGVTPDLEVSEQLARALRRIEVDRMVEKLGRGWTELPIRGLNAKSATPGSPR